MLSARVPARWRPNRMSRALARLRARGAGLIDLTDSNPTRAGLAYPAALLDPLADPAGLAYDPQPRGLPAAREAVARHLRGPGAGVDASRVVLAAGTSEAYSRLFTLLCDPGDEVLVPRPGYPLLDHLTRLDGVVPRPYPLVYHGAWEIDGDALRRQVTPRTRAVVVVNPNNPTGSFLSAADRDVVREVCRTHGLALIADEVFARYALEPDPPSPPAAGPATAGPATAATGRQSTLSSQPARSRGPASTAAAGGQSALVPGGARHAARDLAAATAGGRSVPVPGGGEREFIGAAAARGRSLLGGADGVLTFALGGLSKAVGLPQLKLAWIVVDGPRRAVARALRALEFVSDAYLSVATPVQLAAGRLLDDGAAVAERIAARVRRNHGALQGRTAAHPAHTLLRAAGGWYAVVQVPATRPEEELVLDLIERDRVAVHPGYLYDFPHEAFVVFSLLPEPRRFDEGAARVLARAAGAP